MYQLLILNTSFFTAFAVILSIIKKRVKTELTKNILLLVAPIITLLVHYSQFIYDVMTGGDIMAHLSANPNLYMPLYPCNIVMWLTLIFALLKNKNSKFGEFCVDFIFWFGVAAAVIGMFANEDFIRTKSIADYAILKSIIAHATLLFNVLLLPIFGYVKIDVKRNFKNIIISLLMMGIIGAYCTLIFHALVSEAQAYFINSMFIVHSPFAGLDFLTYPVVALIAVPVYFVLFVVCDLCAHKKGERFYNKTKNNRFSG